MEVSKKWRSTLGSEFLGDEKVSLETFQTDTFTAQGMVDQIVQTLMASWIRGEGDNQESNTRFQTKIVGVFGSWGIGKTHVLNRLGRTLISESNKQPNAEGMAPLVCCFRAWEYEAESVLSAAFLRALVEDGNFPWRQELEKCESSSFLKKNLWEFADLVFELSSDSGVPGVTMAGKFGQLLRKLQKNEADSFPLPPKPVSDQVRAALNFSVQELLRINKKNHLVVLVDDLDRCSPANLVNLFEWFKNHFDSDRTTFIIGLDHQIAAKAIVGRYRNDLNFGPREGEDYGYRYLDKLFDLEFTIPRGIHSEQMALAKLLPDEPNLERKLSGWTYNTLRVEKGGRQEMDALFDLPPLQIPRVAIRTINTYVLALTAIQTQDVKTPGLTNNHLPQDFPFWLAVLCVLHHQFTPEVVEGFVRSEDGGKVGERLNKSVKGRNELDSTDPRQELMGFLNKCSLSLPDSPKLAYLYQMVLDKTPKPFT